ncbi:MAG: M23 family metallopeptidase [Elainellaceae cyanobacterium]
MKAAKESAEMPRQLNKSIVWLDHLRPIPTMLLSSALKLIRYPLALLTAAAALAPIAVSALTVRVSPEAPQLGDTISVIAVPDAGDTAPPTVTIGDRAYPMFQLNGVWRALLPTTPLEAAGRRVIQVQDSDEMRNLAVWVQDRSFPTQSIWVQGGGSGLTETERSQVAAFKTLVTPQRFWNGPFLRPTSGRVSTVFGVQRYYNGVFANDYYHRGVDYATGIGTPIVAPAAGRVSLVGYENQGFRVHGNTVGLDHGQGVLSIFIHLNQIDVQNGEFVQAGQRIGTVGFTGSATGPHLHWGLYVNGDAVDPVPWRYDGVQ